MKRLHKHRGIFDWRLKINLTFKCNLKCEYCPVPQTEMPKFKELTAKEWYTSINKIGYKTVFTGGEPTLYPEIYELLNNINPSIDVSLFSNLNFDVKEFAKNVKRKVSWYLSYHYGATDIDKFIDNYHLLKANKHLNGFSIHSPLRKRDMLDWGGTKKRLRKNGIDIRLDPNYRDMKKKFSNAKGNKVLCEKELFMFAPDGKRYMCLAQLIQQKYSVGHISDSRFVPLIQQWCDMYPQCTQCDLMMNTFIRGEE